MLSYCRTAPRNEKYEICVLEDRLKQVQAENGKDTE